MPAQWHDARLLEWSSTSQCYDATKIVLDRTGIDTAKVTHHKTQGIEDGAWSGLTPNQLGVQSKNVVDGAGSQFWAKQ